MHTGFTDYGAAGIQQCLYDRRMTSGLGYVGVYGAAQLRRVTSDIDGVLDPYPQSRTHAPRRSTQIQGLNEDRIADSIQAISPLEILMMRRGAALPIGGSTQVILLHAVRAGQHLAH
jgi:hypothetical protein